MRTHEPHPGTIPAALPPIFHVPQYRSPPLFAPAPADPDSTCLSSSSFGSLFQYCPPSSLAAFPSWFVPPVCSGHGRVALNCTLLIGISADTLAPLTTALRTCPRGQTPFGARWHHCGYDLTSTNLIALVCPTADTSR